MQWWQPEPGEPELLAWWAPLLAVARRARADHVPWLLPIDDFSLEGRIVRSPRPDVWVYAHRSGCGSIRADAAGRTYVVRGGRHVEVDVRRACWAARLPDVCEPVWFDPPRRCHLRLVSAGERLEAGDHPRQGGRERVDVLFGARPPHRHPEGT